MKKISQKIYLYFFTLVLLIGFALNIKNLTDSIVTVVPEEKFDAWAILINVKFNENIAGKYSFIDANGMVHKILGQRAMNEAVKLDNKSVFVPMEYSDTSSNAMKVSDLKDILNEMGIPLLYVQTPYDVCRFDESNAAKADCSNTVADEFVANLRQNGVSVLDLRDELHNDGLDHYEAFYKTDHHWTAETAFWAFGTINEEIGSTLQTTIPDEYLTLDSYKCENYEGVLGSTGRKTGQYYCGLDNLNIYSPVFDTSITASYPTKNYSATGTYDEVVLDRTHLEGDNLFEMLQYNVYTGNDRDITIYTNENAPVDAKILFVKDSFFRPVLAFMSTVYRECVAVDLRYLETSLIDIIEEEKPDMVVIEYNPYILTDDNVFEWQKTADEENKN